MQIENVVQHERPLLASSSRGVAGGLGMASYFVRTRVEDSSPVLRSN